MRRRVLKYAFMYPLIAGPMDVKEDEILGATVVTHWCYVSNGKALCAVLRRILVDHLPDAGVGSGAI